MAMTKTPATLVMSGRWRSRKEPSTEAAAPSAVNTMAKPRTNSAPAPTAGTCAAGVAGGADAGAPETRAHGRVLVPGWPDVAVLEVRSPSHPVQRRSDGVAGHRDSVRPPTGLDDVRRAVALGDTG